MTAQVGAVAWRCDGRFPEGDGGVTHITKYAKTRQEMLIFRDQGYTCTPLHDEPAAVPVEALEGLVADWREEAAKSRASAGRAQRRGDLGTADVNFAFAQNIEAHADELTQLIKEHSNG